MLPVIFPLRAVQVALALALLALTSYLIHWYRFSSFWRSSPSEVNLLLFCTIWTLLLTPLLFVAALKVQRRWIIPSCEALTMLFWFAAFTVLAVFHHRLLMCYGRICHVMVATIVLGAVEWLFFLVTTVLALRGLQRTGNPTTGPDNKDHEMNPKGTAAV